MIIGRINERAGAIVMFGNYTEEMKRDSGESPEQSMSSSLRHRKSAVDRSLPAMTYLIPTKIHNIHNLHIQLLQR